MAVKSEPGTITIARYTSLVYALWSAVWLVASVGTVAATSTVVAPDGSTYPAYQCMVRWRDEPRAKNL